MRSSRRNASVKWDEVASEGRTVLFVSHNMGAVLRLCNRGIVLSSGEVAYEGSASDAVDNYLSFGEKSAISTFDDVDVPFYISSVRLMNNQGIAATRFPLGSNISIELTTITKEKLPPSHINITCYFNGTILFRSLDTDAPKLDLSNRPVGEHKSVFELNTSMLKPGSYVFSMDTSIKPTTILQKLDEVISFDLYDPDGDFDKSWSEKRQGYIKAPGEWFSDEIHTSLIANGDRNLGELHE